MSIVVFHHYCHDHYHNEIPGYSAMLLHLFQTTRKREINPCYELTIRRVFLRLFYQTLPVQDVVNKHVMNIVHKFV
jgi:hypothetical protein